MTQRVDIAALATLARLEVSEHEIATLEQEIPAILGFVEAIQKAPATSVANAPEHRNVMRDDDHPIDGNTHSKELLDAAPAQRDGRVVVKQVLSRKKA